MSENLIVKGNCKEELYANLLPQIKSVVGSESDAIANMANVAACIKDTFKFWWVGFYRVIDSELVLGPFQGPLACTRIKKGRGVCGSASQYEEIEIDGIKVDYFDAKNKVIHEIKKSNKVEKAHEWQLKYYMYVFEKHGIIGVTGVLEYPLLRKTEVVLLSDIDREAIRQMIDSILHVVSLPECPPLVRKGICKNCSYYEFCYTNENEDE